MGEILSQPGASEPKPAWRAWARSVLKTQSPAALEAASASIGRHLAGFVAAIGTSERQDLLLGYIPIRGEVDPIVGVSAALSGGWRIGVGRGVSSSAPMQPVAVGHGLIRDGRWDTSRCDADIWGVPVPRDHAPIPPSAIRAVLVPGLAFDRRGHRLGRGAGVYDRFLATLPASTWRIGLVTAARLVDALPTEGHDAPMHAIVTEDGCLRIADPVA
ncbi:MAG: 5-formyltetrahydrofolate cyclo-ligase [Phycisphaerales bacterium]|nr:5-formyltetrahydrofolate cyclo-ligase [Phycisphaerales bacterium]